ncbi:alkanesulfonate monooxygenase SsuD/methylene tetrahydromethanopterin reductase-like flavin-dependent oxidoreductase (luciferase family) [Microbacterium sp. BE35]|uniref:LLM class flavin-dependent oxidoreductase n=1 Tax=Microbacterium sp. BE35 TaxID=2817773 RepID=UPI0028545489|nr:LLM class flavin-dependent oxidoreductase [Microbacterium sp. BE35]MDR7188314.1 alkanesulfonate monooxygenase SsuD/methylene tetrahydromethanopterin reductase-like flavin-dependent oxidoreductase (luciferase family) [Microbacterium sp. BE35]
MSDTRFAVALELDAHGAHPAASAASAAASPRLLASRGAAAERFGFTAVTFDDSPLPASDLPRLDAVQRAAFISPLTSAIGLVPVAHVAYSEPFHVATQLASLDWTSNGRAGWIAASSGSAHDAAAYGREALTDAELERERHDVIEVARRLWDSWEDDAVIQDVATGRYLDADKLHYVDFEGESFSVKGPLITPRPPQGQLVVVSSAGTVGADVALVTGADRAEITDTAARARAEGATLVWAEVEVVLDARGVSAARRLSVLGPWPEVGRLRYTGGADGLVALIAELAASVDGVRLHVAELDVDLEELGRAVLPALREQIGFRSPRAGETLRGALGLERPVNRYAATAVKEFA